MEKWSKIILGLVFLALCLWGCEKRVKLSQCEGDTPEEKVEDFLEQKYGEDFVVTEVDSTTTGPFGGYRHAKAYLADDPTQCTFRIWREDGGYDARFLLDMRDEVQEGKLDFKWNDMYADGTIDSCFYGQENEFEKIYYDNFDRE